MIGNDGPVTRVDKPRRPTGSTKSPPLLSFHRHHRGEARKANSPRIHILHENDDWLPPLHAALDAAGLPYEDWSLAGGSIDLTAQPLEGVFWSRLSASSRTRTRGHGAAKDYARALFRWLEASGRRVVNGSRRIA